MAADQAALEFVARLDDQASAASRELRSTMDALGGPVDPITAALQMHAEGTEQVLADVDRTGERAEEELEDAGEESGRRYTESATETLGRLEGAIVPVVAAAGAAAGAVLVASLAGAMSFDAANDKLAAQLGLTVPEAERVGDVAGSVYAGAWGENMDEVNTAVGAAYSSIEGMTTASEADLEEATVKALAFADAFETDVARSTQVVGQLIRTGLAKDADEGFDLLTAAAQRVPANIREDLIDAADEYGPFFASLGLSGEKAFGALVAGSAQGMYGIDKTGDALKELTIRATDMSTTSVASFEAAGLNAQDMASRFLAGGDVASGALTDLANGLLGIEDPTARANAAIGLFGTPLEDLGVNNIPAFLSSLTDAGGGLEDFEGAADRMADTLGDNATSNIESFKRQATLLATDVIGGKLLPKAEQFASTLATQFGPAVKAVTGWMSENEDVVGLLATQFGSAVGVILAVVAAMRVWAVVQGILNVVMLANPIVLIVAAIAVLVAVIVYIATQTTWFQDIWAAVWGGIKKAVDAVVSWWNDTALPLLKAGFDLVVSWLKAYLNFWLSVWNGIVTGVRAAVDFVANIIGIYVAIWRAIITGAINGIRAAIAWFGSLPDLFRGWFNAAADAVRATISRIAGAAGEIVSRVRDTLSGMIETARRIGGDIIDGIVSGIRGAVGRVASAAKSIVDNIAGPVKKLLGIASPSKLFRYFGRMTVAGYVDELDTGTAQVANAAEGMAQAATQPLEAAAKWQGNLTPAPVTVTRAADAALTVKIEHVVTSPDGSVREYTATELADIIARNPQAAGTIQQAVVTATRARDARTLTATN
jgi:phage-related minor tail protein